MEKLKLEVAVDKDGFYLATLHSDMPIVLIKQILRQVILKTDIKLLEKETK